jgi:hypothetical protein
MSEMNAIMPVRSRATVPMRAATEKRHSYNPGMDARTSLAFLLGAAVAAQEPPIVSLPPDVRITQRDYERYLYEMIGSARLDELVFDHILAREVAKTDLAGIGDEVRAALADPDAYVRTLHHERLHHEHGGDETLWRERVRALGRTAAEDLAALRVHALRQTRVAALVQAARQPDAARLRAVFEQHYGVDGLRVRVRQVLWSFARARRELGQQPAQGDADPDAAAEQRAKAAIEDLWRAQRSGTPFAELVARGAEDEATRALARDPERADEAGLLAHYDFQMFGVPFADAVRALAAGEVSPPVRTAHGYHLIRVDAVQRTRYEDVAAEVARLARTAPPSLAEQRLLRERLWAEYRVAEAMRR